MTTMTLQVEIPDWANYVAQDEDGHWFSYSSFPNKASDHWLPRKGEKTCHMVPKDWTKEVYEVVR